MIQPVMSALSPAQGAKAGEGSLAVPGQERSETGKRFEQMLWADMLSHAGLEKSFTLGGGESASAFSRFVVESIAEDLAETHPLGLAEKVDQIVADRAAATQPLGMISDE